MSLNEFFENDISVQKNDNIISDLNISENKNYILINPFKEDFRDCNSSNSISNIIKNQFIKEMTNKNIISEEMNSDDEYFENNPINSQNINLIDIKNFENIQNLSENENIQNFSENENIPYDSQKFIVDLENSDFNHELSFNFNSNSSYSILIDDNIINDDKNFNDIPYEDKICEKNNYNNINGQMKKKIFKVVKVTKNIQNVQNTTNTKSLGKKRKPRGKNKGKNNDIDWDNIPVPKEKHFHLDRKKKRIIFQRKYLKMIYSIVDLEYPFDFNELFNLIKEHVGDKTVEKFGDRKSFHIIRINGKLIVVNMKEKKMILKGKK